MRQFRTYGSVRGVSGNRHPYRDLRIEVVLKNITGALATALLLFVGPVVVLMACLEPHPASFAQDNSTG
jgi:hypothetical protein